jgi:hypothetical protein
MRGVPRKESRVDRPLHTQDLWMGLTPVLLTCTLHTCTRDIRQVDLWMGLTPVVLLVYPVYSYALECCASPDHLAAAAAGDQAHVRRPCVYQLSLST